MVKSRRRASAAQSSVKATVAWRPCVSTSSRSVVTSCATWDEITVTVPCANPVGTAARPAARAASITCSGSAGVAISISTTGRPSSALRTAPPTARAAKPLAASASNTARVCLRVSQSAPARLGSARIGGGSAIGPVLLQLAGLDAPVLAHAWGRVDLTGCAAGCDRGVVDQRRGYEQRSGHEQPHQRRIVDDGAGGSIAAAHQQHVGDIDGSRQQEQQEVLDDD